jgi:hypothetical protein
MKVEAAPAPKQNPSSNNQQASQTPTTVAANFGQSTPKRPRLSISVRIEPGLDPSSAAHEIFPDGSYTPAVQSQFARASIAASAFVARALGDPNLSDTAAAVSAASAAASSAHTEAESPETVATASVTDTPPASWPTDVIGPVDGALDELGRAVAVIEALRAADPLLELNRFTPVTASAATAFTLPAATLRVGGAMLMSKRRALSASADLLCTRAAAFKKWIAEDKNYTSACVALRKHCGALRRASDGTPLLDIGDGNFAPMERPATLAVVPDPLTMQSQQDGNAVFLNANAVMKIDSEAASSAVSSSPIVIHTPPLAHLCFNVMTVGSSVSRPVFFAAIGETDFENTPSDSVTPGPLIRQTRIARMAAFRQLTFERMAREASARPTTLDLTSNSISVESNPSHVICVRRTLKSVERVPTSDSSDKQILAAKQDSSLLSLLASHACLQITVQGGSINNTGEHTISILDQIEKTTASRCTLVALEIVLDHAAALLRVRVDWSRGPAVPREASARVWATDFDGDGPSRLLATFEPVSDANNGGHSDYNGHIRITPAFGVIVPAPDDPESRTRASSHCLHLMTAASSHTHPGSNLDDVPRAYICPVGSGEIMSVITLLLCIRLLDALESAAHSGVATVLDVDRQCFSVIVLAPKTGRTLRIKVWPKGPGPGHEIPCTTVWLDNKRVNWFPELETGRMTAWRKLLREIAVPGARPNPTPGSTGAPTATASRTQVPSTEAVGQSLGVSLPFSDANDVTGSLSAAPPAFESGAASAAAFAGISGGVGPSVASASASAGANGFGNGNGNSNGNGWLSDLPANRTL